MSSYRRQKCFSTEHSERNAVERARSTNCTSAVGDYDTVRCETVTWLLARWAEPITDSQCGEGGQVNSTAVTL